MKKIIIIIMSLLMSITIISFANGGPTEYNEDSQSTAIYFDSNSGIELIDEILNITVSENLRNTEFEIIYNFKNNTDETIDSPILFILGEFDGEDFSVVIDEKIIETTIIETVKEDLKNWQNLEKQDFVTPWDQSEIKGLDYYSGTYSGSFNAKQFDLNLEPNEIKQVKITYSIRNGVIVKDEYFSGLKTLSYYLSPASFYEDSAVVDIFLNVPEDTMIGSNIKFNKVSYTKYEKLDYTIGDEELTLTLLNKRDLVFGTNIRSDYYRVLTGIYIIFLVILFTRIKKRKLFRRLKLFVFIIPFGFLISPTYSIIVGLFIFSPLILFIVIMMILLLKKIEKWKFGDYI